MSAMASYILDMTNIRIEPFPPNRGRKAILVDGERWGNIHMEQHGCWGSSYWFQQIGYDGAIYEEAGKSRLRQRPIEVRSDGKRSTLDYGPFLPMEVKLAIKARELVRRGLLRHPNVVTTEKAAAAERFRQHCADEAAKRRESDLTTAHALIEQHAPGLNDREPLANAIAEALQTARDKAI